MARGHDLHQARKAAVAALGRHLTRRSGSVCELCGGGADLRPVEVEPVGDEPGLDRAMLACGRCRELAGLKKLERDATELRFLETAVWAEVLPVQLSAIRLVRRLAAAEVGWARECLDGLWLDEETEALL